MPITVAIFGVSAIRCRSPKHGADVKVGVIIPQGAQVTRRKVEFLDRESSGWNPNRPNIPTFEEAVQPEPESHNELWVPYRSENRDENLPRHVRVTVEWSGAAFPVPILHQVQVRIPENTSCNHTVPNQNLTIRLSAPASVSATAKLFFKTRGSGKWNEPTPGLSVFVAETGIPDPSTAGFRMWELSLTNTNTGQGYNVRLALMDFGDNPSTVSPDWSMPATSDAQHGA